MPIERPPRVVLDTNVIVTSLLSARGASAHLIRAVMARQVVPVLTTQILAEYHEVTSRENLNIDAAAAGQLIALLMRQGFSVAPAVWHGTLPDRDDEIFMRAALATGSRIITTLNAKHYPRSLCAPVRIMTPAQALAWIKTRQ